QLAVAGDIGGEDRCQLADRFVPFAHRADKADPFAVCSANEALLLAAVADRAARRVDPRAQGRFRDDPPVPHGGEKIVLGNDAVAVADRVLEKVEDLRLERDQRTTTPQLASRRIQREIFKRVEQMYYSARRWEQHLNCALLKL